MSSDKELFDLLEKYKDVPVNNIEQFIQEINAVPSKKPTPTYIIYWVYLHWCIRNKQDPFYRTVFFKTFKKHFKPASRDRIRRYYVKSKTFILHPDEAREAKKECGRERIWFGAKRKKPHQRGKLQKPGIIEEMHRRKQEILRKRKGI